MAICHLTYDWFFRPTFHPHGFLQSRGTKSPCSEPSVAVEPWSSASHFTGEAVLALAKNPKKHDFCWAKCWGTCRSSNYTRFLGVMFRCCVLFYVFYVFKVPEIAAVWVFPSWKKSKDCGLTLGSWYAEPISHHVWIESCTKKTVVGNQKSGENSNQLREGKVVVYPPAIIRGAVAGQDPWVARTVYEYLRTWKSSVLPININHSCR